MAEKVFVSPGVYTSEKDLTFVTRQVGVTTLGLVGETTKGPAFQPIFISNYGEFQSFFGGLNNTLVNNPTDGNGAPLYELPYIAKSYLSQSNQLFVTRVLGFSGYDAGKAWAITLDAAQDPSTTTATTTTYTPLVQFSAYNGTITSILISSPLLQDLYTNGDVDLSFLPSMTVGQSTIVTTAEEKNGLIFSSTSSTLYCTNISYMVNGAVSGVSYNADVNPFINYTADTNAVLLDLDIYEPLTNSFYNNAQFSLSTIGSSVIGQTYNIPLVFTATSTYATGVSSTYIVVSSGLTPYSLDITTTALTTSQNVDPLLEYTATTGLNITAININDSLLNTFYGSSLIGLDTGFTIGNTTTYGPVFDHLGGGIFTGLLYTNTIITTGQTPYNLDVATSGLTTSQNVDPLLTYTADTNLNITALNINDSLLNTFYGSSLIGLSTGFTIGSSTAYGPVFDDLGGGIYTGLSYVNDVISTGLTPYSLNLSTTGATSSAVNTDPIFTFTGDGTSITGITINDALLSFWYSNYNTAVTGNTSFVTGTTQPLTNLFYDFGDGTFTGVAFTLNVVETGSTGGGTYTGSSSGSSFTLSGLATTFYYSATTSGNTSYYSAVTEPVFYTATTSGNTEYYNGSSLPIYITGTTSANTIFYSAASSVMGTTTGSTTLTFGTGYSDVENKVVALLRSRGRVDTTTQLPVFQVSGTTGLQFDSSQTAAETDPLGVFFLTGVSTTQGAFSYECSFDRTQRNYMPKVLGRTPQDGKTAVFVEELFDKMFVDNNADGKIRGINLSMVNYAGQFSDYLQEYQPAVTPYVVSELRGNKLLRLFRMWTISDGNAANEQFKISIANIKPDTREFDVLVRGFYDTDAQPNILESFSRCTMDPTSNNFVGRRIGTLDGTYASKSSYILVELDETSDTSDAFPAGFVGFPIRDYQINSNTSVESPDIMYKTAYSTFENKRKYYLGLSNTVGIDADFFDYKGVPIGQDYDMWTGLTKGFHMDIGASAATIDNVKVVIDATGGTYSPIFLFDTGVAQFRTDAGLAGGPYEKVFARKFTFAPYGGFDGWDPYRTRRTNLDSFIINGTRGQAGLASGTFQNRTLTNGDLGINSDYYAYLEAIWTFKNPEAVNINVFATPGIDTFDNTNLVEATIEMIEQDRADSLYVVTTPDTDSTGQVLTVGDVTDQLSDMYDSSYTATYWPWIQILDAENNVYIYVPPTRDVVRNIALTDNIAFPWFAVAGIQRGDVDAIKARKKLTLSERDGLYENRINPIATFTSDGIKIWGNKTLQIKESALDRINVRRLLLQARKLISAVAIRLLFEQNDTIVRNQFLALVNPILDGIRTERGLTDFRVVLSSDPEDIDRNQLTGKIYLKPTRALEYIIVEFNIMNTGASFDNI